MENEPHLGQFLPQVSRQHHLPCGQDFPPSPAWFLSCLSGNFMYFVGGSKWMLLGSRMVAGENRADDLLRLGEMGVGC